MQSRENRADRQCHPGRLDIEMECRTHGIRNNNNRKVNRGLERLQRIIEKNGEINQLHVAIEEMSELTKCITKYFRYPVKLIHYDSVKEELADVLIMCKQIQIIFGIPEEELKAEMDFKINRTEERLNDK